MKLNYTIKKIKILLYFSILGFFSISCQCGDEYLINKGYIYVITYGTQKIYVKSEPIIDTNKCISVVGLTGACECDAYRFTGTICGNFTVSQLKIDKNKKEEKVGKYKNH